jgi:hypothetical protein
LKEVAIDNSSIKPEKVADEPKELIDIDPRMSVSLTETPPYALPKIVDDGGSTVLSMPIMLGCGSMRSESMAGALDAP